MSEQTRPSEEMKLLIEIFALCMAIQKRTDFGVFVRYSGHVDSFDIEICETKKNWEKKVLQAEFYTEYKKYTNDDTFDSVKWLQAKVAVLKHVLEEHEIPTDGVQVEAVTTYERYF